jgi:TonB family protein
MRCSTPPPRHTLLVTCLVALNTLTSLFPVLTSADESVDPAPAKQVFPPYKMTNKDIFYPERTKQDGIEGKVLVAFDISAGGRVDKLVILDSDNSALEATAREIVSGLRFDLPFDWANSPARLIRYHMGFVFCIPPSSLSLNFGVPVSPVVIRTNRIPGSPTRNPLAPGETDQCAP